MGLFSHGKNTEIVSIVCDLLAICTFFAGLLIEHVADAQKIVFRRQRERGETKEPWISSGLWKYSRHPSKYNLKAASLIKS